jgi:hypothetical protein
MILKFFDFKIGSIAFLFFEAITANNTPRFDLIKIINFIIRRNFHFAVITAPRLLEFYN